MGGGGSLWEGSGGGGNPHRASPWGGSGGVIVSIGREVLFEGGGVTGGVPSPVRPWTNQSPPARAAPTTKAPKETAATAPGGTAGSGGGGGGGGKVRGTPASGTPPPPPGGDPGVRVPPLPPPKQKLNTHPWGGAGAGPFGGAGGVAEGGGAVGTAPGEDLGGGRRLLGGVTGKGHRGWGVPIVGGGGQIGGGGSVGRGDSVWGAGCGFLGGGGSWLQVRRGIPGGGAPSFGVPVPEGPGWGGGVSRRF